MVFVVLGELIRIWGVGYAGMVTRTRNVGATDLITDGPYAYLRNPLYVGNYILSLGFCIASRALIPWMLIAYTLLFFIQYGLIVSLEEEKLRTIFGEFYDRYAEEVPRFFPRFTPYPSRTQTFPDWRKALRSERRTFQAIAIISVLLVVRYYL